MRLKEVWAVRRPTGPGGLEVERAKDLWDEVLQLTFTNIAVGFNFLVVLFFNANYVPVKLTYSDIQQT